MVDQVRIVTFTTPSVTNSAVDVTHAEITEAFSAAILIFTKETSDGTDNTHGMLGVGFIGADGDSSDSTVAQAITLQSESGVNASQEQNTLRNIADQAIRVSDGVAVTPIVIAALYVGPVAGGFRLNFTVVSALPDRTKCTAIIFAGLEKAASGQCTFTEAEGHEDVGTAGDEFEPHLVIFRSSDNALNTATANATLALGYATNTSPIQQVSSYVNWDELTSPTTADGYMRSDCCSAAFIGDRSAVMDRFAVTSFDSTGFNAIAFATLGLNSPQANYLALRFSSTVRIACANMAVSGSTGIQTFDSFGFQPDLVLGMSTLMTVVDAISNGAVAATGGHFVTGRFGSRAYTAHAETGLTLGGATVSSAETRQEDVAVLTYDNTGGIAHRATWGGASGSGLGFLLDFSVATSGYLTALGIGLPERVVTDSETITETVGFAGALTLSESETITEEVGFAGAIALSETLTIEEFIVLISGAVASTPSIQGPKGYTFGGGAERGTSYQGGAEAGIVL